MIVPAHPRRGIARRGSSSSGGLRQLDHPVRRRRCNRSLLIEVRDERVEVDTGADRAEAGTSRKTVTLYPPSTRSLTVTWYITDGSRGTPSSRTLLTVMAVQSIRPAIVGCGVSVSW